MNEQNHQFENIAQQLKTNGFTIDEIFQIAFLIDKLPDTWTNFAKTLSHTQGDLTLIQVLNSIRIEEQHKLREKAKSKSNFKVNNIESNPNSDSKPMFKNKKCPFHQNQNKTLKRKYFHHNKNPFNFQKKEGDERCAFFVCDQTNHLAKDFFYKKTELPKHKKGGPLTPKSQVNMLTSSSAKTASGQYSSPLK